VRRVAYEPGRLRWQPEGRVEPLGEILSIEGWLALHGYEEVRREERKARERIALADADATADLARTMLAADGDEGVRVAALSRLNKQSTALSETSLAEVEGKLAKNYTVRPGTVRRLMEHVLPTATRRAQAADEPRPRLGTDGVLVAGRLTVNWLHSDWFEEWVWLSMRNMLTRSGERVRLALKVAHIDRPGARPDDAPEHEFDTAFMHGNQLHAIECKTGASSADSKTRQGWLDRLHRIRTTLIGIHGSAALLVAEPLGAAPNMHRYARLIDIELASGAADVRATLDRIRTRTTR